MNNFDDIMQEHKRKVVGFIDGVRDASYIYGNNEVIDNALSYCRGTKDGEDDCRKCVFARKLCGEWDGCYLEELREGDKE